MLRAVQVPREGEEEDRGLAGETESWQEDLELKQPPDPAAAPQPHQGGQVGDRQPEGARQGGHTARQDGEAPGLPPDPGCAHHPDPLAGLCPHGPGAPEEGDDGGGHRHQGGGRARQPR